jgi:hypothetical protein
MSLDEENLNLELATRKNKILFPKMALFYTFHASNNGVKKRFGKIET